MIIKEKVYKCLIITQREGEGIMAGLAVKVTLTPLHRGKGWVVKLVPRTNINTTRNKRGKRGGD